MTSSRAPPMPGPPRPRWSTRSNAIRRAALEQAVNRLSKNATMASDEIVRLVTEAGSESVRLQAARAVLAELMALCNHAVLEPGWTRCREGWTRPWRRPRRERSPIRVEGRLGPPTRWSSMPPRSRRAHSRRCAPPALPPRPHDWRHNRYHWHHRLRQAAKTCSQAHRGADSGARADRTRGLGSAPTFVPRLPGHPSSDPQRNRSDSGYD